MSGSKITKKTKPRSGGKSPTKPTGRKGAARGEFKQAVVIAQLNQPTGTTIAAIIKATGWQQHSVRGFLAGVVRKRLRLNLNSRKIDGTRVYRIAGANEAKANRRQSKRLMA